MEFDGKNLETSSYLLTFKWGFDGTTAPYFKQRKCENSEDSENNSSNESNLERDSEQNINLSDDEEPQPSTSKQEAEDKVREKFNT